MKEYINMIVEHGKKEDMDCLSNMLVELMYELKEALKQLFKCEVDLVRFRDSLRPLFKSNIQKDVIYVWQSTDDTR